MFSKKSPNETSASPRCSMRSSSGFTARACSASRTRTTSPPRRSTVGPSIESTNATVAPLPGMSIFTCVPAAMVWSSSSATAGWNPTEAKPVLHARPYRSRKPPSRPGVESTERPTITSRILFADASSPSPVVTAPFSSASHSQPSRWYISMRRSSFLDLPISPSLSTRSAPPRTRSVFMRAMLRWLTSSTGSVSTPSSSTGRLEITATTSSSSTLYWKLPPFTCLSYRRSSSTNRPVSSSCELARYLSRPAILRTWSAMSTVTADSVPPADRMGPAMDSER